MSRILVVENEPALADVVERCLRHDGYTVNVVNPHRTGLSAIDRFRPDLIILDLVLPGMKGIGLCRNIRARTLVPIILLAPRVQGLDELLDGEVSMDDYVRKPFRPRELTGRVKAVLHHFHSQARVNGEALHFGDLRISPATRSVEIGHQRVKLTPKEFDLLRFLAAHPGQIFSREQLLYNVWDYGFVGDQNTIAVHIRRIRSKTELNPGQPRHLKTVLGAGYKFEP